MGAKIIGGVTPGGSTPKPSGNETGLITKTVDWFNNPANAEKLINAGRWAGALVSIYGTYKMAKNLQYFYSGDQTQAWVDKGWFMPNAYASNFLPKEVLMKYSDFPDYHNWDEAEQEGPESVLYLNMAKSFNQKGGTAYINWEDQTVEWSVGAGEATSIIHTETLQDYNDRTNKMWLPIDALKQITGLDKAGIKDTFGLSFDPSYVWISDEGMFFAGSRINKGTYRNRAFVEMDNATANIFNTSDLLEG